MNLCEARTPSDLATEIPGENGQKQMIPAQKNLERHQGTGHTENLCHSHHQMVPAPYKMQIGAAGAHMPEPNDFGHLQLHKIMELLKRSNKETLKCIMRCLLHEIFRI